MPRKKPLPQWVAMKKVVKKLHRGGMFYPKDLSKELGLSERTVDQALKNGVRLGIFWRERLKGQYAWIDYKPEEPKILEAIEEFFDSHPSLRGRPLSAVSIDEIIYNAGAKALRNPKNPDFIELVLRVLRKT